MNPTGTCALCKTSAVPLIDSHIVSKWVYRRIIGYDPTPGTGTVAVADGRAGYSSKQDSEYLLCRSCEDRFGTREDYVARNGLQPDSTTFPALTVATSLDRAENIELADASALDVDQLTYFAASVFWRADVAHSDPIVDLAEAREPIRQYLLGQALPTGVDLVVTLIRPQPHFPRIDRVVAFPGTDVDTPTRHEFIACGMRFTMFTSAPHGMEEASLPRKKRLLISDGQQILNAIAEEAQTSMAYGKLALKGS
jgi:hypothetical protein